MAKANYIENPNILYLEVYQELIKKLACKLIRIGCVLFIGESVIIDPNRGPKQRSTQVSTKL